MFTKRYLGPPKKNVVLLADLHYDETVSGTQAAKKALEAALSQDRHRVAPGWPGIMGKAMAFLNPIMLRYSTSIAMAIDI